MHLSIQGRTLRQVESLLEIIQTLDQMDGVIITHFLLTREDGSYLQMAGAKNRLCICMGRRGVARVIHTIIGLSKRDESEASISYSGGEIIIRQNEILMYEDAILLITSFSNQEEIPSAYSLREVKGKFI